MEEESTAVIRQQMDDTKNQLSQKLQSLEHQVSETVQTTGTAVNATVGAVQETVESITGAVQDAMKSVTSAFDLQQHVEKHPWIVLGGAVVLGYLSCELVEGPRDSHSSPDRSGRTASLNAQHLNGAVHAERPAGFSEPRQSHPVNTAWNQIASAATVSFIGILQEAAAKVVPQVMEYLGCDGTQDKRNAAHSGYKSDDGR
jgi:hypothetical protein